MAQIERKMGKEILLSEEPSETRDEVSHFCSHLLLQYQCNTNETSIFNLAQHFRKALQYMGVPLPHTTVGLVLSFIFEIIRQITHWLPWGTKLDKFLTKTFHNEQSVMEIATNYHMLSQEFFSNSQFPFEGWVCLIRGCYFVSRLFSTPPK